MKILLAIVVTVQLGFVGLVFHKSLPTWCANPNGSGNWAVQPLCKE